MNAVAKFEDQAPMVISPLDSIRIQISECADLARLEKLMELEKRWHAEQAERQYVAAFAAFKKNMPDIVKDMLNKQYGSDYSSLANLVNTTNKVLGEYGLNASWDIDQSDGIKAICILKHVGGHRETVSIHGPADNSGQKNAWQQIKSALTYAEGATFQAITGVVARSACVDDDGNSSGARKEVPPAPSGYDRWSDDLRAVADKGSEKLLDIWKKSEMAMRTYMVKHENHRWEEMKRIAKKESGAV